MAAEQSGPDMTGRVCLVTGATSGIGRATALGLARLGATVVLHGRDRARGEQALAEIVAETGTSSAELLLADLSSQAGVRQLAAEVLIRHDRLHVLVNNAGVIRTTRSVTVDGHETTFAVNHLAYFLLTHLLLDRLQASAPARIVNVSSSTHRRATIDFDDLHGERRYGGFNAYGKSKLANVLFTYELARRLEGTGVTANALHPGNVATRFGSDNSNLLGRLLGGGIRVGGVLARLGVPLLMLTPERGAETSLYVATSPEVEGVSGRFFEKSAEKRSSDSSHDETAARRLWEMSEQLTGLAAQS